MAAIRDVLLYYDNGVFLHLFSFFCIINLFKSYHKSVGTHSQKKKKKKKVSIGDRALVTALARCPLLGLSVKRGSTVAVITS